VITAVALRSFTPVGAAAARGTLGAAVLAAILLAPWAGAAALRPVRLHSAALWRLAALGLMGGAIFMVAMNVAVALAGATITAFVAGLYAVLAAALAVPMLGERPDRITILSLGLALIGTLLLGDLQPSMRLAGGIGVGLVAAISFALFLVLSRRWSVPYGLPGPSVALAALALSGAGTAVLMAVTGIPLTEGDLLPEAAWAVAWLALGPGALAAVLVVIGMRRLPARRASAFLLLNPPTAAVLAWVLLGERLSPVQLLGGALVLAAMAGASGLLRPWSDRQRT
jgi:drug/metabolite transporter (DMT)-like permease